MAWLPCDTFTPLVLRWPLHCLILYTSSSILMFCWGQSRVRQHCQLFLKPGLSDRHKGGTDICSLFAGMCSALPVYRGEIQCRMLGMAVECFTPTGSPSPPDEAGELVCVKPFPCMPLGFWPLPGYGADDDVKAAQVRYQEAYFSEFEGVWCKSISLQGQCNYTQRVTRSWRSHCHYTFERWKRRRPCDARTFRWCSVSSSTSMEDQPSDTCVIIGTPVAFDSDHRNFMMYLACVFLVQRKASWITLQSDRKSMVDWTRESFCLSNC